MLKAIRLLKEIGLAKNPYLCRNAIIGINNTDITMGKRL
ncbi:hypothetical protein SAMN05216490_0919 [Mucilaginibacter mallensis]|uniref:Uncharacterized protein n=1 Tax=Mucilaginibacter mallensis TaxID=652787 RepID=A0A1H1R7D6_MUCMA|nr:hypothetical protein SAMN05216490_0919 [Mucilaginibacter mallensis]